MLEFAQGINVRFLKFGYFDRSFIGKLCILLWISTVAIRSWTPYIIHGAMLFQLMKVIAINEKFSKILR